MNILERPLVFIRFISFTVLMLSHLLVNAQRVSTVAGGTGDDGQALAADLFGATTVAVNLDGDVIIADALSRTIRKVNHTTGTISRIAGTGAEGPSGDGGLAINASFGEPSGVAVDASGNIYVSDQVKGTVRKIDVATGIITRIAGGAGGEGGFSGDNGLATNAKLLSPHALGLDANGNIYITDTGNQRIRMINAVTNIITTVAGNGVFGYSGDNGPATSASLSNPNSVAVDANGNIYISDYQNFRIRKVNSVNGVITTVAGTGTQGFGGDNGPATSAMLDGPSGVMVDLNNNLILSDTYNQRIRKINLSTGIISTIAGTGVTGFLDGLAVQAKLNVPQGLAMDATGNIYFSEFVNRRVRKISGANILTIAGNGGFDGDGGSALDASLQDPQGVAIDADGNVFIADSENHRIRKVDSSSGSISTIAGNGIPGYAGDGGLAINAQLYRPRSLEFDKDGNLFIAAGANNSIRKVDMATGKITTVAGIGQAGSSGDNGLATNASLYDPQGLAFDSQGNLFIADTYNHKIRKVTLSTGVITTVAGNGVAGFSGDNGSALTAQLNFPVKITLDASDNLFIVDSYNSRIRKVDASTNVITTWVGGTSNDQLMSPTDVFIQNGDLYILEAYQIKRYETSTGTLSDVGGTVSGYSGDDQSAFDAQFKYMTSFTQDADGNFYVADSENNRIRKIMARLPQTLLFDEFPVMTFGDPTFDISAEASSGLPVLFTSSNTNVALVNNNATVTIVGAGTTTITAVQPGNIEYLPAESIPRVLIVNKADQNITFPEVVTQTFGDAPFAPDAVASSGLAVTYSSASDKITISGSQVTMLKPGRVTIQANQPGNSNYLPALSVEQGFCVNPPMPVITQTLVVGGFLLTSSNDTGNQWYFEDELVANANQKTFKAEQIGTYTVQSTTDDCVSSFSDPLYLLIVGVEDVINRSFQIYPNPADDFLMVKIESGTEQDVLLEINDRLGRKIMVRTGKTNESLAIDIRELTTGIYFIKATSEKKKMTAHFLKR